MMDRRIFIKSTAATAASLVLPGCNFNKGQVTGDDGLNLPKPLPCQLAWQDAEISVVYHYEMRVFKPDAQANRGDGKGQWGTTLDPDLYQPARLNTDQWLEAAIGIDAGGSEQLCPDLRDDLDGGSD